MNKKSAFLTSVIILALGALGYWLLFFRDVQSERIYIDTVVVSFLRFEGELRQELIANQGTLSTVAVTKKWYEKIGGISGVSEVVFGERGQVLFLSHRYSMVMEIAPKSAGSLSWKCTTYPKITYESGCSKLNAS